MVVSILDTDLYKLTMSNAYYQLYPESEGTFTFSDRNNEKYDKSFLKDLKEKFKKIVEHFNVDVIAVCGIMSEVCVLDTIKGLVKAGYKDKLVVYPDFCPSLDGGKTLTTYLEDEGINYK